MGGWVTNPLACLPACLLGRLQALAPRALLLVRLLLAGVVGALPSARQQEITDVLYAILKVGLWVCVCVCVCVWWCVCGGGAALYAVCPWRPNYFYTCNSQCGDSTCWNHTLAVCVEPL